MLRKLVPFTPAVTRSRCSELRSIRRSLHSSVVSTSVDLHRDGESQLREPCLSPETPSRASKRISIAVQCRSLWAESRCFAPQFYRVGGNSRLARECRRRRRIYGRRPNSSLKLTVRRRFSRRPSRLPRLEFARRRATCTGIIGCAASGAPLDAGRRPAARNLTSRR